MRLAERVDHWRVVAVVKDAVVDRLGTLRVVLELLAFAMRPAEALALHAARAAVDLADDRAA